MESSELQKQIVDTFTKHFGYTPKGERIKDITNEFFELMRSDGPENELEEIGDLISTLIKYADEHGVNFESLCFATLAKINRREEQYRALGRKLKVALYGGAFDPIHKGHIQVCQFVLNTSKEFDEVWIVPCFSHMYNKKMAPAADRLEMCKKAAERDRRIKVYDYEISNKLKGETFYFLKRLREEIELLETHQFSMIIGQDNANNFQKWVNFDELEKMIRFVVVPRQGVERDTNVDWYLKPPHIYLNKEKNNISEVSSTEVRKLITSCRVRFDSPKDIKYLDISILERQLLLKLVDEKVWNYILEKGLYKA